VSIDERKDGTWLLFKDPLDLEVRYELLCMPDGNDPNWDFEPSTWIGSLSESSLFYSVSKKLPDLDRQTQIFQNVLQAEQIICKDLITDPLTYSDSIEINQIQNTIKEANELRERAMPTGFVSAINSVRQPQVIVNSQISQCNANTRDREMPPSVFTKTCAELADFLFQNPGNFHFTTSIDNDALTLLFQPTPFSSLIDAPNLEPLTPRSPSYSPIQWARSSKNSSNPIVAPGPSLISVFGDSAMSAPIQSQSMDHLFDSAGLTREQSLLRGEGKFFYKFSINLSKQSYRFMPWNFGPSGCIHWRTGCSA